MRSFSTYYGFELVNRNSITVSVNVKVYCGNKLKATEEVILKSGETYIMKRPIITEYPTFIPKSVGQSEHDVLQFYSRRTANDYYLEYTAFKLQ